MVVALSSVKNSSPTNRQIFTLSWPIAMNAVLLQAILVIDTTLVAPLGEETVAAMGLATSVAGIVLGVLFALANGTQILLAQAYGAGSDTALKSAFWCGLFINAVFASVSIALILVVGPALLDLLAATPTMGRLAWEYTQVFLLVVVGVAVCQNFTVYFNATGDSRIPFYSNLLELPFNAFLSYALIHGAFGFSALGLVGAAWGSAVAVCIRAVFLSACLLPQKHRIVSAPSETLRRFWTLVANHWTQAWPVAATYITMSLSMSICMMMYASLPVHEFAALTILFLWVRVAGIIVTSWGQATGILIGQLLGQGQNQLLDEFVSRAWRLAFMWAAFVVFLNLCSSYSFAFIYPELQINTLDVLAALTPMFVLLPLLRTSNVVCGNVLRAGGDAGYAFRIHVCVQCLFTLPLSALFVFYFNLGVLWVFSIILVEELIKAVPFHLRMRRGEWKTKRVFRLE